MITARLVLHLKRVGIVEQSGFMPSPKCVDAAAVLKIALQSLKDSNQQAYLLFVDLMKASFQLN
jgi:16S rRNA A1518/A1519 N6-dimethyltransferase RsmA/KsgA/DIM1 with predicted DNA glycosylase/AP lyase activity